MRVLKKILPVLFFAAILGAVIYFIEPPVSWVQASVGQILVFLLPSLALVTSLSNLILNHLPRSFAASLGAAMLLVLWMIDRLGVVTGSLTVLATALLIFSLPKRGLPRFNRGLTRRFKRPKLRRLGGKS